MSPGRRGPPRLWTRILRAVLAAEDRGPVAAELRAVWEHRLESEGPREADRWYGRQVRGFVLRMPVERARRRVRDLSRLLVDAVGSGGAGRDVRHGLRALRRSPGFTAATVAVLGLGIATAAALATLLKEVVLDPLPYPEAHRLVEPVFMAPGIGVDRLSTAVPFYLHFSEQGRLLEEFAVYDDGIATVVGPSGAERIRAAVVSANLLPLLGAEVSAGRLLGPEDSQPGAPPATVLSHELWTSAYGADPGLVGRTLRVGGEPTTVVGILAPGFRPPDQASRMYLPLEIDPADPGHGNFFLSPVARLAPGATLEEAERELAALAASLDDAFPGHYESLSKPAVGFSTRLVPYREAVIGDAGRTLWLLAGATALLLVVAWANAGGLVLVHAEGRRREVAVRAALGGSGGAITRLFVVQGVALAALAGIPAALLAREAVAVFVARGVADLPRLAEVEAGWFPVASAAALAVVSGVGLGLLPVLGRRRNAATSGLSSGSRRTIDREGARLRRGLVAVQVALGLVLLAGAGLLARTASALASVDPGFEPQGLLTFRVALPDAGYEDRAGVMRFFETLEERLSALPGVESVAGGSRVPFTPGGGVEASVAVEDRPLPPDGVQPSLPTAWVMEGYAETLGMRLLEGRTLTEADRREASGAAVVSRAFARRFWPEESALGRRIRSNAGTGWHTVVGVVEDVRDHALTEPPGPLVLYPLTSPEGVQGWGGNALTMAVRTSVPPSSLTGAVRAVLRELDPEVPLAGVRTGSEAMAAARGEVTLMLALMVAAAASALVLGAVGLYGVLTWAVARRVPEIGVRMALGASRPGIRRMVLADALPVVGVGLLAGLAGAVVVGRLLESVLYGVEPLDGPSLAAAAGLLAVVALAASVLPAVRATRVSPLEALREGG